jgi:hypothetical protein
MEVVRALARDEGVPVIDNLERWERLRLTDRQQHRSLMRDALHVNALGNMLWGMDVARCFGIDVGQIMHPWCHEALTIQSHIDRLRETHVK